MDEEDLREAEDARRLETNRIFAGIGGPEDGSQPRSLMDLLMPAIQDTMGTKLLKKMGWKEGQGIGPKTMRTARDFDGEPGGESNKSFLFAPENSKLVSFRRKDNAQGLGYVGEGSLGKSEKEKDEDAGFGTAALKPAKPKKRSGPAFGVGILNEDGEDEEDPYEIRPKSSYNRVIGGDKPKKAKPAPRPLAGKHVFVPKKAATLKSYQTARKCHDGRLPLPGFILSDVAIEPQAPRYPPPKVPADWKGMPEETPAPKAVSTTDGSVPKLDPRARGALLGEAPLPGKSVFDFLTPDARNRIANLTGKTDLPQGLGEAPPSHTRSTIADIVPHLDSGVAMSALKGGYMPYGDDLEKRARYRSFLEVKAGLREGLPDRVYTPALSQIFATATKMHRNMA
jgi:G patch domain-containing protein 1